MKIKKHLQQVDEKIKNLEEELPNLESEGILDRLTISPFSRKKTQQSVMEYIQSLKNYKEELTFFYGKNENLIGVYIRVESDRYDENISVEFVLKSGKIVRADELVCPWLPSDPAKDHFSFLKPIDSRERDVYRTNLEYGNTTIKCDLRYLKKGQPVLFINEGIYIDSRSPRVSFEFRVTSKNSDGLRVFPFDEEKTDITEYKDISELNEFDKEI